MPREGLSDAPEVDALDLRRTATTVRRRLFSVAAEPVAIDRFVIEGTAGVGAMGRVYRARDPVLKRAVALKMIATEKDAESRENRSERLLAEAKALARLEHPNVVSVYAAGAVPAGVFIAMEYLPGGTLREWIDRGPYAFGEAWPRLREAGRGLVAAHELDIVHRDFKPSNVLIGARGHIKVADFGLALVQRQPTGPELTERAGPGRVTDPMAPAGTPRYMAPEQWKWGRASARSDQYSYCIVVREALDPGKTPRFVARALQRGLHEDPLRRFSSMRALLRALDRRPRRRAWFLGLAAAAGAVGFAAKNPADAPRCEDAERELSGVWDEEVRAQVERAVVSAGPEYASDLWTRLDRRFDEYARDWAAAHAEACGATTIRHERSEALLDRSMACLDDRRRELWAATAVLADSDPGVIERAERLLSGLGAIDCCLDETASCSMVSRPDDPEVGVAVDEVRKLVARSDAERRAGRYSDALELSLAGLAQARETGYAPVRTEAAVAAGLAHDQNGEYAVAVALLEDAYADAVTQRRDGLALGTSTTLVFILGDRLGRLDDARIWARAAQMWLDRSGAYESVQAATLHGAIGTVHYRSGAFPSALESHKHALAIRLGRLGGADPLVAESLSNVGLVEEELGAFDSAQEHHEQALEIIAASLGARHPRYAELLSNRSNAQASRGDFVGAERSLREALAIQREAHGSRHPKVAGTLANLALNLNDRGRPGEAVAAMEEALSVYRETLGPEHPSVGGNLMNLGFIESRSGNHDKALAHHREAERVLIAALGEGHLHVGIALHNKGVVLRLLGQYEAAVQALARAMTIVANASGPESPALAMVVDDHALALSYLGRHEEALALHQRALTVFEGSAAGPDSIALTLSHIGITQAARGAHEEAVDAFTRALTHAEKAWPPTHREVIDIYIRLARAHLNRGRSADATKSADEALTRIKTGTSPDPDQLADINELARILCRQGRAPSGTQVRLCDHADDEAEF